MKKVAKMRRPQVPDNLRGPEINLRSEIQTRSGRDLHVKRFVLVYASLNCTLPRVTDLLLFNGGKKGGHKWVQELAICTSRGIEQIHGGGGCDEWDQYGM